MREEVEERIRLNFNGFNSRQLERNEIRKIAAIKKIEYLKRRKFSRNGQLGTPNVVNGIAPLPAPAQNAILKH